MKILLNCVFLLSIFTASLLGKVQFRFFAEGDLLENNLKLWEKLEEAGERASAQLDYKKNITLWVQVWGQRCEDMKGCGFRIGHINKAFTGTAEIDDVEQPVRWIQDGFLRQIQGRPYAKRTVAQLTVNLSELDNISDQEIDAAFLSMLGVSLSEGAREDLMGGLKIAREGTELTYDELINNLLRDRESHKWLYETVSGKIVRFLTTAEGLGFWDFVKTGESFDGVVWYFRGRMTNRMFPEGGIRMMTHVPANQYKNGLEIDYPVYAGGTNDDGKSIEENSWTLENTCIMMDLGYKVSNAHTDEILERFGNKSKYSDLIFKSTKGVNMKMPKLIFKDTGPGNITPFQTMASRNDDKKDSIPARARDV